MALIGSEHVARRSLAALPARLKTWLLDRSDRSLTQRMAGAAFLIRVASAAVAYLSQVLLARWMGSFEFGVYVYVWTWVLLVGGLMDFGLALSAQRFIPEYSQTKAFDLLRGFLAGSRWLAFGVTTLAAILAGVGIRLIEPWLDNIFLLPLYLACLCLPLYALTGVQDGIARAHDWLYLGLLPPYVLRPVLLIAIMAGAHLLGLPANAATAMTAAVAATWATAIVQLLVLNRRLSKTLEPGPKAYAVKTWLATSLPIFMVEGFYHLLMYTDILVLQQYRPSNEVAVYYAASKTLALVAFVYFAVSAAAAHRFTAYHVSGDRARLAALVAGSVRWTFWPSIAATLLILLLGRPILWLFGPGFVDGYMLMFILAVGLLARASIGPVERLLNMLGQQRICAAVYAAAFAINLLLTIVLIPRIGVVGAAVATASAFVIESILLFIVTKRRLGLHAFIWGGDAGTEPNRAHETK